MTKVQVYPFHNGAKIGYTVDPIVFAPPIGWRSSRPFEYSAAPSPQGVELKTLIEGLNAHGFYIGTTQTSSGPVHAVSRLRAIPTTRSSLIGRGHAE